MALASRAAAAPQWVDRGLTMRQLGIAFDLGLGVATNEGAAPAATAGPGLNLDGAIGILDNLELGVRFGMRLGDGAENAQADQQGRLFDYETYGTGNDLFANPEVRLTGRLLDLSAFELGLEGRFTLPFERNTRFSFMPGVPMRVHLARIIRIDTGVYVPVVLHEPGIVPAGAAVATAVSVNIPVFLWFQATPQLFLGPLTEFRINDPNTAGSLGVDHGTGVLFGAGAGYSISRFADIKGAFVFPRINGTPGPDIGFGVALGLHFD